MEHMKVPILAKIEREEERWTEAAGKRAMDSLVYYGDPERVIADQREAMRFFGKAEMCREIASFVKDA